METAKEKIAELLEQQIGLKISSIGTATVDRALAVRMRAAGIEDLESYYIKLTVSRLEMGRLVEEVVVPETWFFRDLEPFNYLTGHVLQTEKDLSRDIFRILSLPCSTGEEPYSIAMTLLDAGLTPGTFYIDAVDVSERVLERARTGLFRENSFRTADLSFRDKYFNPTPDGFKLKKIVHDKVRFLQGNLLQPAFMESLGKYDVVFCRNVLIYFSEDAQQQAIDSLYSILVPGGVLFTGHAEASLFHDQRFVPIQHAKAFAFFRNGSGKASVVIMEKPSVEPKTVKKAAPAPPVQVRRTRRQPPAGSVQKRVAQRGNKDDIFAEVRKLADAGRLDEAARISEENLSLHGPSPRWYHLLGIIRDSQGRPEEAKKLLRKALYLDPASVESLVHLSLLAERDGDAVQAANFRRRAKRIEDGG